MMIQLWVEQSLHIDLHQIGKEESGKYLDINNLLNKGNQMMVVKGNIMH
jgi:hypothetical protein